MNRTHLQRVLRGAALTAAVACLALVAPLRAAEPAATVRTFEITASKYKFEPARIEVVEGETVRLVLHSTDTSHGLGISAFGVDTQIPKGGAPVSVEFVANKPGTFEFKCSHFCGMGHRRMKGELVVAPRAH
jgi:cytochrome c oxidase subunit 2